MTAAIWPTTLPQKLLIEGFAEGMANNRIRSSTDVGPAKVRPRSTAAPRTMVGAMAVTTDQLAILRDFLEVDVIQCSSPFSFPGQTDDVRLLVRIADEVPQWSYLAPDYWKVDLKFEILPGGAPGAVAPIPTPPPVTPTPPPDPTPPPSNPAAITLSDTTALRLSDDTDLVLG